MKMKMKNYGKMGLSFEFSMKICEKNIFSHFLRHFLLIEAKMKMKMKKYKK